MKLIEELGESIEFNAMCVTSFMVLTISGKLGIIGLLFLFLFTYRTMNLLVTKQNEINRKLDKIIELTEKEEG